MKLLKLFGIIGILLLMMPMAYAQTEEINAGITPDSPLYGLDKVLDQLSLNFQFSNQARYERALDIAEERLAETEQMINENQLQYAEQSRIQHQNMLQDAEETLEKLESEENPEYTRLRLRLETHNQRIEQVRARLQEKLDQNESAEQIMNQIQQGLKNSLEAMEQSQERFENRGGQI